MQQLSTDLLTLPPDQLALASKVNLTVLPDVESLYQHFALSIADEIRTNNEADRPTRLILPVGPVKHYPILAEITNQDRICWKNVHTFNMDEYCDWQGRSISIDHPLSFERVMRQEFFENIDPELRIPKNQAHFPDPLKLDEISQQIEKLGGIDTCYGGVGFHGHVAFNEPPVSRWYPLSVEEFKNSLTRVVLLAPETMVMNSFRAAGGNTTHFPPQAVTLGMLDILSSKRIRLYCDGGVWQRHILRIACLGEPDVDYPVTLLQEHPDFAIITDRETSLPPGVH